VGAARGWAARVADTRSDVERIGYFGSYATGRSGVGSDLDLLIVVSNTTAPFERRAAEWETSELPVPTDLLVYTAAEWQRLGERSMGFGRTLQDETRWLWTRAS
jgi:predicted nucleotidyltransferase